MRELVPSDYDWTDDVAALKAPVLVLVGDGDGLRLAHAVELSKGCPILDVGGSVEVRPVQIMNL